jgi:hypothetical protein
MEIKLKNFSVDKKSILKNQLNYPVNLKSIIRIENVFLVYISMRIQDFIH